MCPLEKAKPLTTGTSSNDQLDGRLLSVRDRNGYSTDITYKQRTTNGDRSRGTKGDRTSYSGRRNSTKTGPVPVLLPRSPSERAESVRNRPLSAFLDLEASGKLARTFANPLRWVHFTRCAVIRLGSSAGVIPVRQLVVPAGSNRSGGGGNEFVEAFDVTGHSW